jgi:subtilase-type serine protease
VRDTVVLRTLVIPIVFAFAAIANHAQAATIISSSFIEHAGGTFTFYLYGTPAMIPSAFPIVLVTGSASLDGTLAIFPGLGFTPSIGDSFPIMTAADGITGQFATEILPPIPNGNYITTYTPNSVVLSVVVPEPTSLSLPTFAAVGILSRRRTFSRRAKVPGIS